MHTGAAQVAVAVADGGVWMRPRTSFFSIRHTPSPTAGIRCPLLRVTDGTALRLCPFTSGATSFAAIVVSHLYALLLSLTPAGVYILRLL